jgi:hypothetical protein
LLIGDGDGGLALILLLPMLNFLICRLLMMKKEGKKEEIKKREKEGEKE